MKLPLIARWRLWWGFCPACNSDAPALDKCKVCLGARAGDMLWIDDEARRKQIWGFRYLHRRSLA